MTILKLFLLGPPRVELDGVPVDLQRRKAVALLAYLALTAQPHSRDALATLFWPDLGPAARPGLPAPGPGRAGQQPDGQRTTGEGRAAFTPKH